MILWLDSAPKSVVRGPKEVDRNRTFQMTAQRKAILPLQL